ncbi:MAG: Hpt domain-containing protein [Euryhalocaulis sp.]|uniref:Hpt domain-containing protein n=1 Tax=Euryhalocaulis sp. TaxID=2744307 RepID=UPI0017AE18D9|nr:Hpt domain-containing protein [Euryhalocaulis sp.]MBA4801318.1 Hpt domain-containing protein [Euryhalocaulis sp.]
MDEDEARRSTEQAIALFRSRFIERCANDAEAVRAWRKGRLSDDQDIISRLHKLAGLAGTFGFPELGREAAGIEDALSDGDEVSDAAWDSFLTRVDDVVSGSEDPVQGNPGE